MEPMNATQTHSKVRVTTSLSAPIFVAGGEISGKMELDCRTDSGLGINTMMVELIATQELTSRDHSATSVFMSSKRLFQGPGLPPSNAVYAHPQPGAPSLPPQYHQARKGCTTFFFNFPLPLSSPNSITFGNGLAKIFYEVRATVAVFWKGERTVVRCNKEVQVTECLVDSRVPREPSTLVAEGGKIVVQAQVIGGIGVVGRSTCVELQVKNHSHKKTSGLTLTLLRTLHLPNVGTSKNPFQITDTIVTVPFRGAEYTINPGVEGVANLVFEVPRTARGVKGGPREKTDDGDHMHVEALFHVNTTVSVAIAMGIGSKDIKVDVPLTILHPIAVPEPQFDSYPTPGPRTPDYAAAPLEPPRPYYALPPFSLGPPSPTSHTTPPLQYQHTPTPPHVAPYMPQMSPVPFYGHQSIPVQYLPQVQPYNYIPTADQMYYYPPPPQPIMDYFPRPTSATPMVPHSFTDMSSIAMPPLPPAPAPPTEVTSPQIAVAVPGQTEEGKGERASRISLHLKGLSRHRSVSPTSHRYRMTGLPLPPSAVWVQPSTAHQETPELLPPAPKLHSPRPMLSPKASFTGEPLAGSGQSGRVAALEKMVEEEERSKAQEKPSKDSTPRDIPLSRPIPMSPPSPIELEAKELNDLLEKTLPNPPVPSTKPKKEVPTTSPLLDMFNQRAQAAEALQLDNAPKAQKPVFVMANLAPKRARQSLDSEKQAKMEEGEEAESSPATGDAKVKPLPVVGLDALEHRLLKEVGTRKQPAAVVRHLREMGEATDVAIKAKVEAERNLSVEPHFKSVDGSMGATVTPSEDKEAAIHVLLNRRRRKTSDVETPVKESEVVKTQEEEALRLRKAAKGRIAMWLGAAQEADPPPLSETRIIEQAARELPVSDALKQIQEASKDVTGDAKPVATSVPGPNPAESKRVDPSKIQLPGRTSSGFLPMSRQPANGLPRIAESSSSASVEQPAVFERYKPGLQPLKVANYDVRSARGGRGGKVTSVAALWAEKAVIDAANPTPVSPKIQRDGVPLPLMVRLGQEKTKLPIPPSANPIKLKAEPKAEARGLDKAPSSPPLPRPTAAGKSYPWFGPAISPARSAPAEMIAKGTSVPAKLSSSIASPTLSSTESLARPQPTKPVRPAAAVAPKTPVLVQKTTLAVAPAELQASASEPRLSAQVISFGQARLKGLIAKYQGGGA